jgi:hypothetical protein
MWFARAERPLAPPHALASFALWSSNSNYQISGAAFFV